MIKLSSYLEKYFRYKTATGPDVKKYFDIIKYKQPDIKFAASWNQNLQQARGAHIAIDVIVHAPWWCSRISTSVFGKSNRHLEYVIF